MNNNALKEKLRKEILNCNSSAVKGYDLSLFDDNDVDVFEKIVYFDNYSNHYYSKILVNNNELMYKLFFEYNIKYNSNEENIEELDYKSSHFGSLDNYLKKLELIK